MQSLHGLDRLRTGFDDERLVAHAGLLLPATLAAHLGLRKLVDEHLDLGSAPGRAHAGASSSLWSCRRWPEATASMTRTPSAPAGRAG